MPPAPNGKDLLIGVDLGGTKILAGVFDTKLNLIGTMKVSTKPERGVDAVIDRIARCVKEAIDECDLSLEQVKGIGIGAPGAVDPDKGEVIFAPNLNWKDVPLEKELGKCLEKRVFAENDCNIAALGVHQVEFEGRPQHLVGIFLGTGIGGGLILNGKLFSGFNRTAGELGHMVLDPNGPKCSCGNKGCFETFSSRQAIFRRVLAAVKDGEKSVLTEMLGNNLTDMRSGDIRKAVRKGDKLVTRVIQEAAEYAGIAVGNLINILNPEIIVLGGGVIEQLDDEMMPIVTRVAREHVLSGTGKGIEIRASKLGDHAGITGGATLARQRLAA